MEQKRKKPVVLKREVDDAFKIQAVPKPIGAWPYQLKLGEVLDFPSDGRSFSFHAVGDTGSVRHSDFQAVVARELGRQITSVPAKEESPAFLLHLGDIVYNFGEAKEYADQFFKPYEQYPAPIFALSGNHDADINPDSEEPYTSLEAFLQVFCDGSPKPVPFSGGSRRLSMIQPNIYWLLDTPLANFICLYGNATKFGTIDSEQEAWFIERLKVAQQERREKALIVCLHQAPYSADINHGSSLAMIDFLDRAFAAADVWPDIVLSGHVHCYERFSKTYPNGLVVPYLVAGAGGYADLHPVAALDDITVTDEHPALEGVALDNYCDDHFGFLKITVQKETDGLKLIGTYYILPQDMLKNDQISAQVFETFTFSLSEADRQTYADAGREM